MNESDGFADLGLPMEAWELVETLPLGDRLHPAVFAFRLKVCTALERGKMGMEQGVVGSLAGGQGPVSGGKAVGRALVMLLPHVRRGSPHPGLSETRLIVPNAEAVYPSHKPLIGGKINLPHIRANWDELRRLTSSIRQGTVTASLILRKLAAYPQKNGLAVSLREVGRIERNHFILTWLQSTELRRHLHAGLNKGEARNALARAVFFHPPGEIRDRSFDQQRHRASRLSLAIASIIVLWNMAPLFSRGFCF